MNDHDDSKDKGRKNTLSASNKTKKQDRAVAVAIKDRDHESDMPTITAAGRGKIAEQILQIAFENDVKVREDSDLAELLATIELDSPIPGEAFMAVAEILSYVYKANSMPNPFDTTFDDDND